MRAKEWCGRGSGIAVEAGAQNTVCAELERERGTENGLAESCTPLGVTLLLLLLLLPFLLLVLLFE